MNEKINTYSLNREKRCLEKDEYGVWVEIADHESFMREQHERTLEQCAKSMLYLTQQVADLRYKLSLCEKPKRKRKSNS